MWLHMDSQMMEGVLGGGVCVCGGVYWRLMMPASLFAPSDRRMYKHLTKQSDSQLKAAEDAEAPPPESC